MLHYTSALTCVHPPSRRRPHMLRVHVVRSPTVPSHILRGRYKGRHKLGSARFKSRDKLGCRKRQAGRVATNWRSTSEIRNKRRGSRIEGSSRRIQTFFLTIARRAHDF